PLQPGEGPVEGEGLEVEEAGLHRRKAAGERAFRIATDATGCWRGGEKDGNEFSETLKGRC
ncbi:MAG TPA: hypothetical protein VFI53_15610, partial [Myxococcaceae bacterium]|nr:hypothetical protein [Myxococcaceae bacterium]